MIFLVLLSSIIIALVTINQFKEQSEKNNIERFEIKELATKEEIHSVLQNTSFSITTNNLKHIFQDKIYHIANVHKLTISIYDMPGCILKSSIPIAFQQKQDMLLNKEKKLLDADLVNKLANSSEHKILYSKTIDKITYKSSFSYITDTHFKFIGILEVRIAQDKDLLKKELQDFLERLFLVYLVMFLLAIVIAYFLSKYVTKSIKTIAEKIKETRLYKSNEKIQLKGVSTEINELIVSYNNMIDLLEDSADKLAKSEREQAWREMAKQVAHEIKNPLTPMRLSVQNFERRFDPEDPKIHSKMKEYSETLIQQIDVMSSIATAFSDFAKMPRPKLEQLDVVDIIKHTLDIFSEDYIIFNNKEEIIIEFDKTQLIRILTNLVKNSIQSMQENKLSKSIEVAAYTKNNMLHIDVKDNGKGISETNKKRIFEPKFTTKTSGMGLGLPMIKKIIEGYSGSLTFTSTEGVGTVFKVKLPIN